MHQQGVKHQPSTFDKTLSVSLLRITTNSQGCLLLALPDQRATSSTVSTISCGIGSGRNWRTARSRLKKVHEILGIFNIYRVRHDICVPSHVSIFLERLLLTRKLPN